MGERGVRNAEVEGSNPLPSTTKSSSTKSSSCASLAPPTPEASTGRFTIGAEPGKVRGVTVIRGAQQPEGDIRGATEPDSGLFTLANALLYEIDTWSCISEGRAEVGAPRLPGGVRPVIRERRGKFVGYAITDKRAVRVLDGVDEPLFQVEPLIAACLRYRGLARRGKPVSSERRRT